MLSGWPQDHVLKRLHATLVNRFRARVDFKGVGFLMGLLTSQSGRTDWPIIVKTPLERAAT